LNHPRIHPLTQVVLKNHARDPDLPDRDRTREPYLVNYHPLTQVIQTNSRPAHSAANLQLQSSSECGQEYPRTARSLRALLQQKENQCQES